jgi:phosphoesterase RecJ-like protein
MEKYNWNSIIQLINKSKHILLTTHINPDGDGLGSELAMYCCLKKLGKNPLILNVSKLPKEYEFLNRDSVFNQYEPDVHRKFLQTFDFVMVFDITNSSRITKLGIDLRELAIPSICIDHHPANHCNFDIKVIDEDAPATSCLVYELIKSISPDLMDKNIAEALYVGLLTDTGAFRFENTTPEALELAAKWIRYGLKPSDIYRNIYENKRPEQLKLLGMALQEVNFEVNGKIAWFKISGYQIKKAGASAEDVDGFTDFVRTIKGVEVAVMFLEVKPNAIRINFRSKGKLVINRLAEKFGGGGHPFAAGALLHLPLQEASEKVISEVIKLLKMA